MDDGPFERMKRGWAELLAADGEGEEEAAERCGLTVATVRQLRASRAYGEARRQVAGGDRGGADVRRGQKPRS